MKHNFLATLILSLFLATGSLAATPKNVIATREIAILNTFNRIVVGENINVILVQDPYRLTVTVSGNEKSVEYIQANIVNHKLKISSKKNLGDKKITVYIPVINLSIIELSYGSSVSGEGVLTIPDLTVIVSSDSRVALNILGNITVKSSDDCNLVYEKNEKYKVIPAIF